MNETIPLLITKETNSRGNPFSAYEASPSDFPGAAGAKYSVMYKIFRRGWSRRPPAQHRKAGRWSRDGYSYSRYAELESLGCILDELKDTKTAEDAAEKTFLFFHELAILSGNVLLPLMYHSFKAPGVHLWSIYAKKFGIKALYDLKTDFYRALLNRDEEGALAQVHRIMQNAVRDLSFYGT